jgi:hypothetical protein
MIRAATKGLLTFVPGIRNLLTEKGTGGTDSAQYCYGVWLKHLTLLWQYGLRKLPNTLAELGPGDSLGVGFAAMLCGVNRYYALDVIMHSNTDANVKIFDELVELFKIRAARPKKGWPDFDQYLDRNLFPSDILTEELLTKSLSGTRLDAIRNAITGSSASDPLIQIKYMVPWLDDKIIERETVDVILSHSVLEHVEDLEKTYRALYLWLKPKGMMSHQIDFRSHGISAEWNGYRRYSEFVWKIVMGKRTFLINRQPHSVHLDMLRKNGFTAVCNLAHHRDDGISRSQLSKHWRSISEHDLTCSEAYISAIKK